MDRRRYAASETLKDGTAVIVRAIRRADASNVLKAFHHLDRESVYRRFFSPKKELTAADLEQITDVDFGRIVGLVVVKETSEGEVLIGGGRYAVGNPSSFGAEIAFVTAGDYRGLGVASLILRHLVLIARDAGLSNFEADVLADNPSMLAVFRKSGLPMQLRRDGSVLHVTLSLEHGR
jgi:GNAT superfamily N-acetyltransferase